MKIVKKWWLLTTLGVLLALLGIWIYANPAESYMDLSILFSFIIFISGILEITFAIINSKIIKGWGWLLSTGLFDLVIGIILTVREDMTVTVLPFIFGIWLIFRGVAQISKGFLLKEVGYPSWSWSIFGGSIIIVFGFMVVYNPDFGSASIVIWTALSLMILGLFTILFSLLMKKLHHILKS